MNTKTKRIKKEKSEFKSNPEIKKPIYQVMKVFGCQWDPGMPEDVKRSFFRIFDTCPGNDVFVSYEIGDTKISEEDKKCQWAQDIIRLDKWLTDNGAKGPIDDHHSGETVLIKHWW